MEDSCGPGRAAIGEASLRQIQEALIQHAKATHDLSFEEYSDSSLLHEAGRFLTADWRPLVGRDCYEHDTVALLDDKLLHIHIFGYLLYFLTKEDSFACPSVRYVIKMLSSELKLNSRAEQLVRDGLHRRLSAEQKAAAGLILTALEARWAFDMVKSRPLSSMSPDELTGINECEPAIVAIQEAITYQRTTANAESDQ